VCRDCVDTLSTHSRDVVRIDPSRKKCSERFLKEMNMLISPKNLSATYFSEMEMNTLLSIDRFTLGDV